MSDQSETTDLDGMRHAAAEDESSGHTLQAEYLRRGADEIERLRAERRKTTVEEPLAVWMGAVTHILDQLAYAAGLEIDRAALIDSYNSFTGECWTSDYVKQEG